jgi:hypothetical protein
MVTAFGDFANFLRKIAVSLENQRYVNFAQEIAMFS